MKLPRSISLFAAALALGACEQKHSSAAAPTSEPLAQAVSTQAPLPQAPPLQAPPPQAPPPAAPAEVADPFELLDRAKAAPPTPPRDPQDVQKEAIRRARELRAESDRVREIL